MSNNEVVIRDDLISYVLANHASRYDSTNIPLDESLVELGVLDSYGVVELVVYMEGNWKIDIADHEITHEYLGSINKMVAFIQEKLII